MLHTANNTNFVIVMYEFNQLTFKSKKICDINNVECTIYYHIILSQELI